MTQDQLDALFAGETPATSASPEDGRRVFDLIVERVSDRALSMSEEPEQPQYQPWRPTLAPR